jgi:hypothetical protein
MSLPLPVSAIFSLPFSLSFTFSPFTISYLLTPPPPPLTPPANYGVPNWKGNPQSFKVFSPGECLFVPCMITSASPPSTRPTPAYVLSGKTCTVDMGLQRYYCTGRWCIRGQGVSTRHGRSKNALTLFLQSFCLSWPCLAFALPCLVCVWCDSGLVLSCLVWCDLVLSGVVLSYLVWSGLDWCPLILSLCISHPNLFHQS